MTTQRSPPQRTHNPAPLMTASQRWSPVSNKNACRTKRNGKRKNRLLRSAKALLVLHSLKILHYNNRLQFWNKVYCTTFSHTLQNWSKKGSGEKGRGGGGKLPPRFAKKQSSQQQQASQSQPPVASTAQAQQQPSVSAPPHPHLAPSQPAASPQTLEGTVASLPSIPPATVDFTSKSLPPAPKQTHSTLGTELWENKVAGSTVLPDVKKRE